jgi:hypothetical protein
VVWALNASVAAVKRSLVAGEGTQEIEQERAAADAINIFRTTGFGSSLEQATRPPTIGYALLDSPAALAVRMLDHDTDACYQISRAFTGGQPSGRLTRDHVFDNITVYWLTAPGPRRPARTGRTGDPKPVRPGSLPHRSSSGSGSPHFPARSSAPRAAGSS